MKMILTAVACFLLLTTAATSQEKQQAAKSTPNAPALEPKVRKVWEDFKNKNKESLGCAKKKCKLHAVREMREGPSKPLCRERLQTATSCCGTMATVVNVVVKSVDRPRQVWMRETNASEPPIKHRNLLRRRQNRGLRGASGSVWWKPVYWPDGVRCIGGVTLI
jgi:hypothetical protein